MTRQIYRLTRRHGTYAAGAEIELTEAQAIVLDNNAPGVLERIIPIKMEHTQDQAHGQGHLADQLTEPTKPTAKDAT